MEKVAFKNLSWPKGLNLDLLSNFLSEADLINLIIQNSTKDRKSRRIVLPSRKTILKTLCHFYGSMAEQGELSWDEVMDHIKGKFKTLKETGIDRKKGQATLSSEEEGNSKWTLKVLVFVSF